MGLNKLNKAIESDIVNPALAKQSSLKSGLIINATYSTSSDMTLYYAGGNAMVDVILYSDSGENSQVVKAVPLIKIPGIQQSLPPVGSIAILAFLDGDQARPICIGIIGSEVTNEYTKDHLSPRVPPKKMSK